MKRLVIDASVARAAGGLDAKATSSKMCREFLQEVLGAKHQLVWTLPIAVEWDKHASRFSRAWRVQMVGRRRVAKINAPEVLGLRKRIKQSIQWEKNRITDKLSKEAELPAAEKDHHLLTAALASDQRVASLDNTIRTLFAFASPTVAELGEVIWVNPNQSNETPLDWLREDAPADPTRTLAQYLDAEAS